MRYICSLGCLTSLSREICYFILILRKSFKESVDILAIIYLNDYYSVYHPTIFSSMYELQRWPLINIPRKKKTLGNQNKKGPYAKSLTPFCTYFRLYHWYPLYFLSTVATIDWGYCLSIDIAHRSQVCPNIVVRETHAVLLYLHTHTCLLYTSPSPRD